MLIKSFIAILIILLGRDLTSQYYSISYKMFRSINCEDSSPSYQNIYNKSTCDVIHTLYLS